MTWKRTLISASIVIALMQFPAGARTAQRSAEAEGSTRTLYLSLIRQAREDGKARAALAYLDDFDRQHPNDREAQIVRVNCLLDLGQIEQAEAAVQRIPASDRSGPSMAVRGHVLSAQKRWPDAVVAYEAAQLVSPADPFIGNALGYAQLRAGHSVQAVETLKRAVDLAPQPNTVVRNNLALALTTTGRMEEANALMSRVKDSNERTNLRAQIAAEAKRIAVIDYGVDAP